MVSGMRLIPNQTRLNLLSVILIDINLVKVNKINILSIRGEDTIKIESSP